MWGWEQEGQVKVGKDRRREFADRIQELAVISEQLVNMVQWKFPGT